MGLGGVYKVLLLGGVLDMSPSTLPLYFSSCWKEEIENGCMLYRWSSHHELK